MYKYFQVCALEKRGRHTLSDIDLQTERCASNEDVALVLSYIEHAASHLPTDVRASAFLNEMRMAADTSLMKVHLTRDYQVIETGSHYVKLLFRTAHGDYLNNLKFYSRFRMGSDGRLEKDNKVHVSYSRDYLSAFDGCCHTITMNPRLTYYREEIFRATINASEAAFSQMPSKYGVPCDYVPTPDTSVETCVVC